MKATRFWIAKDLLKIGKPVDRTEWGMTPPEVNAYYSPNMNEIAFPAGILQPPFFSSMSSPAANYGAIGAVIGHELTHGFDDEGRQYDANGNLKDWWSPSVSDLFTKKASCLVDQYSSFSVAEGSHVNGKLTLGENIADLGGLKIAYQAYHLARAGQPPAPLVAGLSENQQIFVSFAQVWCTKSTPEYDLKQIATDPHSPARFRVNGVVANLPEFAQAFGCSAGTPMAPVNRCSIW